MSKAFPILTAGLAALLAALAFGVSSAAAGSTPCWKTLLNDYFRDGRVDNTYQLKCYNQALSHLDEDTVIYGSAVRDIHRALLDAELGYKKKHPASASPGPNSLLPPPTGGNGGGGGGHHPRNFFQKLADAIGPGNATSIPLPLLILAGIGLLLVLAAGGSYAAKWIHARRIRPQPATSPPTARRK